MKTETITLGNVKDADQFHGICQSFGLDTNEYFEYGEYGSFEIIVDEKLNIVGGRVVPTGRKK